MNVRSIPQLRIALLAAVAMTILPGLSRAQNNWLQVLDPREGWWADKGTIEHAELWVRPEGVYMLHELDLTFSARGTEFRAKDTLEVVLFFNLPADAFITDSWLWFGEDTLRAKLIDRWTASQIYENIVRRRRDPSILTKHGPGQYELRVFPMDASETRRVRLFYYTPTIWSSDRVTASLPRNVLETSKHRVTSLIVHAQTSRDWAKPTIPEIPELVFEREQGSNWYRAEIEDPTSGPAFSISFPSPLEDGVYMRTLGGEQGWYQLALHPGQLFELEQDRRVTVVLDYNQSTTHLRQEEVIRVTRSLLRRQLRDGDAFNLILSRLNNQQISPVWIPATDAKIDSVFDDLGPRPLAAYSNLPFMLSSAIEFVDGQEMGGGILLVSSSDQFGDLDVANALLEDLRGLAEILPPVHIVDIATQNIRYYWFGGQTFAANEYFYSNLARQTGGNYESLRDGGTLLEAMDRSLATVGAVIEAFDLYISMSAGFTYGRLTVSDEEGFNVPLERAILQVGRFAGGGTFGVHAGGIFNGQPFGHTEVIDTAPGDSSIVDMWNGTQIGRLERRGYSNSLISEIIALSLESGILSQYTAFLALEPGMEFECENCRRGGDWEFDDGGGGPVDAENDQPDVTGTTIEVYPNPFTSVATISVSLADAELASEVSIEIFDVMGRVVASLTPPDTDRFTLTWDGADDTGRRLPAGAYFIVLRTPNGTKTVKVVLV